MAPSVGELVQLKVTTTIITAKVMASPKDASQVSCLNLANLTSNQKIFKKS